MNPNDPRIARRRRRGAVANAMTFEQLGQTAYAGIPGEITTPGPRPKVYQTGLNGCVELTGGQARPVAEQSFECNAITISYPVGTTDPVKFGFCSGLTLETGIDWPAGVPLTLRIDDTRELFELQRVLEYMAAILAGDAQAPALPTYRPAKVVFDASQIWLISAGDVMVSTMLFFASVESY